MCKDSSLWSRTLVETTLVEVLEVGERSDLGLFGLLLDKDPQLLLQLVRDFRELADRRLVVGDHSVLQERAAGELVKVLARVHVLVHVVQNIRR